MGEKGNVAGVAEGSASFVAQVGDTTVGMVTDAAGDTAEAVKGAVIGAGIESARQRLKKDDDEDESDGEGDAPAGR